jgi:uncharacterized protein YjbI with pentapeptide repeats
LPLLAFFFLAPILFLIVHAYTLVHLVLLTDKAKQFDRALREQIGDENAAVRDSLRRQLPSNIFIQFLAGPGDIRGSAFGWMLRAIAWSTLVIAPVLLLLLMQIQFLPFHYSFITWTQRIALLADLVLLSWLWRKILSGVDGRRRPVAWAWTGLGLALGVGAVLFSWTAATFPGEWQEDHWPDWRLFPASDRLGEPIKVSLHDLLFNLPVDETTRRRGSFFSSTLVLPGLNVFEGLKIDDPEKVKGRDFVLRARGRDLKGAIFDLAILPEVDFTGAKLQGASLERVQLQGASLNSAQLQGASLFFARLRGAQLSDAHLQGAVLIDARFEGARLDGAQLKGAVLVLAHLQGASLANAKLEGANLGVARLQGASLDGARLQGTSLVFAQLQGASLMLADLQATDLSSALLWRTHGGTRFEAVRFADSTDQWLPSWKGGDLKAQPWNDKAFQDLRKVMESLLPDGSRNDALERIQSLDCANPDPTFASCDPSGPLPPAAAAWRKALENTRVDDATYAKALAAALKTLVCSGDDDAAYVLRGLLYEIQIGSNRLTAAGPEAPALVDFIMSKDCPLSASLTDAGKAKLLRIKQDKRPGG